MIVITTLYDTISSKQWILPQHLQNLRRIWHFISLFAVISLNLQEILNNHDKQNIPSIYLAA